MTETAGRDQAIANYITEILEKAEHAANKDEAIRVLTRGLNVVRGQLGSD